MPSDVTSGDVIAFIGLGRMGARMAARLAGAGNEVIVWNRTPARPAVPGAQVAPSAAAAVSNADLVITMLSDAAAVTDVLFGEHAAAAAMRPGTLLIDMSTIGPYAVADIRRRLPAAVALVDAPVLGSVEPAASGTLSVLAGGADVDLARCQKVLEEFGEVRHVGPLGSGAAMKLATMSILIGQRVLVAETLGAATAYGIDQDALLDILSSRGLVASAAQAAPAAETRYALQHAVKDLGLAQQTLGHQGVDMRLVAAARARLAEAEQAGLGGRDLSAIYGHDWSAGEQRILKINPPGVPAPPPGRYSHAVRVGDLLFVSGQVALDADGNVVGEGDIEAQSELVFDYLGRILAHQGATFDDVVSIRTFLTDMTMLPGHGAARRSRFTGEPPSSTTVEVSQLFRPGLLVEVDVVAAVPRTTD